MTVMNYDYARRIFLDNNCELLENNYINAKIKMKYRCSCGNIACISYDSFRNGSRCKKCGFKRGSSKRKFSYNYVKEFFESQDCELLSKEFINANSLLKYKCKCGTVSKITFHSFKDNKSRCKNCYLAKNSGIQHWKWIPNREEAGLKKKFRKLCYQLVTNCFEKFNLSKNDRTYNLLEYNSNDLKKYIINHPNWSNVKNTKWHIDHIYPIDAFVKYRIKDLSIINCLENLQPIIAKDNLKKFNKYNKENFLTWLKYRFNITPIEERCIITN
jgi:hypothetical protein